MQKIIASFILTVFISTSVGSPAYSQTADLMPPMPASGAMVHLSPEFNPAYLKGIVIHPENALRFDFIIHKGDKPLSDAQKKEEYAKLAKYFMASLAIPDENQWVNLSPYEKDRIIKDDFGKTEMGRDLLAQDYLLKQITASLIYPQNKLGKKFWDMIYAQAQQQYGTTNVPVNTFNKVWILPDNALIYEKDNAAYVLENHLKVMLEEDYLSLEKHSDITSNVVLGASNVISAKVAIHNKNNINSLGSKIVRKILLPALEREVNEGKNFAPLRQVYSGMLLAAWYKRALKESLLSKIYADKSKVKGVDQDAKNNEKIYQQYLKAYKKGVFNIIKEDVDKYTHEVIPRKYFSGGAVSYKDYAQIVKNVQSLDMAQTGIMQEELTKEDLASIVIKEVQDRTPFSSDAAMSIVSGQIDIDTMTVAELGDFSIKTTGILKNSGLLDRRVLDFVVKENEDSILGLRNSGRKTLIEIQQMLRLYKLRLGMTEEEAREATSELSTSGAADILTMTVAELGVFSIKTTGILKNSGLLDRRVLDFVVKENEDSILGLRNSGKKTVTEIQRMLGRYNLRLGMAEEEARQTAGNDQTQQSIDSAQLGGIDLNAIHLNLQIKRDGKGVPLPISQQNLENIKIDGLIPVIVDIQSAASLPIFTQLRNPAK